METQSSIASTQMTRLATVDTLADLDMFMAQWDTIRWGIRTCVSPRTHLAQVIDEDIDLLLCCVYPPAFQPVRMQL